MTEGKLFFINKPDPSIPIPIENKYVTEIDGIRDSFLRKEEALLYLFDKGIRSYKLLTKNEGDYVDISKVPIYEFWQVENRVGYVLYDYEPYVNENNEVKKRRAYVWRFVGFGRSCFAPTKDELKEKARTLIHEYQKDPEQRGYNLYPFYTRYYRYPSQTN